ncbi:MAG: hypothetical protein IAI48_00440 [Candidatus Eremiobacteraeota bacterium]|nr:hypothetical protein [Candidatus Eremiobacteraeota bacterium]
MTIQERIDRAILFRAHAMDGVFVALNGAIYGEQHDAATRHFILTEWAPRRWIRAGRVLNALLTRKAAL